MSLFIVKLFWLALTNFDNFYLNESLRSVALTSPFAYDRAKEVHPMLKKKHYLYLDESEHCILIRSLIHLKNRLLQEGRFTDCVDELILKAISAPTKRI